MLRSLSIRDFVIVDRLDLEFSSGFTALTGETGAGKSILVDALGLVLGDRGDAGVVRQGAERAEITAEFEVEDGASLARWLKDAELASEETCLMRRVIDRGGRSRAFINGTPVTVAQLRDAGEFLVDIHGQHEHQSLLRGAAQRELLDGYAGVHDLAGATMALYRTWRTRREQRMALESDSASLAAERERLEWQLKELKALEFTPDGWQELNAEHGRLAHAASLIEGTQYGLDALSEAESSSLPQLNAVIARLTALSEYDPALREVLDVLEPARIQMQEAVYSLRHYQQKLDVDPQRLRALETRLDAIHSACRKNRVEPDQLPQLLDKTQARLEELGTAGDAETLKRIEDEAFAEYTAQAQKLTTARRKAAEKLGAEVTSVMQTLALGSGSFEVVVTTSSEPGPHGLDQIEFRVATHKGMTPQPLSKVASGGELSRLSLAIQTVTSEVAQVATLVYDEDDAGIGGRVAEIVGRMLKQLGGKRQVMCITHLPQVAASADHQWRVAKTSTNSKIASRVTALDDKERVDEIARMLGGVKITETTRKHAAEMLGLRN
jgi:DNA repair protein RecN (Recombination protein N)